MLFDFFIERGVVWEETIILLPDNVHYVFLSATIPNARQFAEWISHLHKQVSSLNTPVGTQERSVSYTRLTLPTIYSV